MHDIFRFRRISNNISKIVCFVFKFKDFNDLMYYPGVFIFAHYLKKYKRFRNYFYT